MSRLASLGRSGLVVGLVSSALASGGIAQTAPSSASGTTSILLDRSLLTIEPKDGNIALGYKKDVQTMDDVRPNGKRMDLHRRFHQLTISGTTTDGKRDLIAAGGIVPGISGEYRFAWRQVRNYTPDPPPSDDGRLTAFFVSLSAGYVRNSVAVPLRTGVDTLDLGDEDGATAAVGLGFNYRPSTYGSLFGVSGNVGQSWNVPKAARASHVCVTQLTGIDVKGNPISAAQCSDRYVGGTMNARVGLMRVDIATRHHQIGRARLIAAAAAAAALAQADAAEIKRVQDQVVAPAKAERERREADLQRAAAALGSAPPVGAIPASAEFGRAYAAAVAAREAFDKASEQLDHAKKTVAAHEDSVKRVLAPLNAPPSFAFIGAATAAFRQGSKTSYGFAFGPTLYAPMQPLSAVVSVLAELQDATNALGDSPDFKDRFAVRLYVGVPLPF